ncbi:O-antigen ligase family protein [Carboxylicivirga caseinilyticus]|uniref:O-antigen ligase family protein n=1 Tax=Carboxylicivirga caseinilyticus TaxID=3417572 RepID=UPI003D347EDE|nr:hypothetical protein [Marinilabiliaceae bacterium A049]
MLELLVILILVAITLFIRIEKGITMFMIILPFHAFIKNFFTFFMNGGGIFANWKELVLLVILGKIILSSSRIVLNKNLLVLYFLFLINVLFFFFFTQNKSNALNPLRNHLFFIITFIIFSNIKLDYIKLRKFVIYASVSYFIGYIFGFIQLFIFKIPLGFYMGRIESISADGYIWYTTTSARILGFERMAGVIGGPNDFGLFVAVTLLFSIVARYTDLGYRKGKMYKLLFNIINSVGIVALAYSLSRAAWAIFIGGLIMFVITKKVKIKISFLLGFMIMSTIGLFMLAQSEIITKVYSKTISGDEASSADRLNDVNSGFTEIFNRPWGNGLGTTNNQNPDVIQFFAESATINMIYEIGFIGYFLLVLIYLVISIKSYFKRDKLYFARLSLALVCVTFAASFFSVNTQGMPYIILSWAFIGLGVNPYLEMNEKVNIIE